MKKNYNWGILATGNIAHHFANGMHYATAGKLQAVASREMVRAKAFATEFNIPNAHGSYEDLYYDSDVDIIYVATPHNMHYENVKGALNAGKHVLCEKAFTLYAQQAQELIEIARKKNVFLMEAMWNRFQPVTGKVREIINSGMLGEIMHINADLAFRFGFDAEHRVYNPKLGGGSLLDLGVYPISYVSMLWGAPQKISAIVHKASTGVDEQVTAILQYPDGKNAQVLCSTRFRSPARVDIIGTKGRLKVHGMMIRSSKLSLEIEDQDSQTIACPYEGNAYQYQAIAVMDMLDKGLLEHPLMPLSETLSIMQTMDKIRHDADFYYPGEK